MAIKIFCNQCQQFIKDIEPRNIAKLTGDEICQACKDKNKETFSQIETIKNEGIDRIRKLSNEYLEKLDSAMRQVAK